MSCRSFSPVQERTFAVLRRGDEPVVFDADEVAEPARPSRGWRRRAVRAVGRRAAVGQQGPGGQGPRVRGPPPRPGRVRVAAGQRRRLRRPQGHRAGRPLAHRADADRSSSMRRSCSLADDPIRRGDYLAGLSAAEHAALRGRAVERTTKFFQQFPPLDARAHPMLESSRALAPARQHRGHRPSRPGDRAAARPGEPAGDRRLQVRRPLARPTATICGSTPSWRPWSTRCRRAGSSPTTSTAPSREVEDVSIGAFRAALRRTMDGIALACRAHRGRPATNAPCGRQLPVVPAVRALRRREVLPRRVRGHRQRQLITRTWSPGASQSHTRTASSGSSRMQPLDSPRRPSSPTDASGWTNVPVAQRRHRVEGDAGARRARRG